MNILSQNDIISSFQKSGIHITDSALGIGRELSYRDSQTRTIVVHFVKSDFPGKVKELIACILQIDTRWIIINRYGELKAKEFTEDENQNVIETLIENFPKIQREGDDVYLLGKNGKCFVSYDHHIFDSGMAIYLTETSDANILLQRFNELGAEIELFAKN